MNDGSGTGATIMFGNTMEGELTNYKVYFPWENEREERFDLEFNRYAYDRGMIGINGPYMIDEMLYCYKLSDKFLKENNLNGYSMEALRNMYEKLQPKRLDEIGIKPSSIISLRKTAFLIENGLWRNDSKDPVNYLCDKIDFDRKLTDQFIAYDQYQEQWMNNRNNCIVHAIETNQGVHLFDISGYGKITCKAYLQYLADNFYSKEIQGTDYLKYYTFLTSDEEIIEKARKCRSMLDPYDGRYRQQSHLSRESLNDIVPTLELEMTPLRYNFKCLVEAFYLNKSDRNLNIEYLTKIAEDGFGKESMDALDDTNHNLQIIHGVSFKGIHDSLNRLTELDVAKNHPVRNEIIHQSQEIAKRILRDTYKARGYYLEPAKRPHPDKRRQARKEQSRGIK